MFVCLTAKQKTSKGTWEMYTQHYSSMCGSFCLIIWNTINTYEGKKMYTRTLASSATLVRNIFRSGKYFGQSRMT